MISRSSSASPVRSITGWLRTGWTGTDTDAAAAGAGSITIAVVGTGSIADAGAGSGLIATVVVGKDDVVTDSWDGGFGLGSGHEWMVSGMVK